MKAIKKTLFPIISMVLIGSFFTWPAIGFAQKQKLPYQHRTGVYINLTEDFYRALREEESGTSTYSTKQSDEYLRQIAVSAKFMVESNLQILKQQDQIIQLLESLNSKRK